MTEASIVPTKKLPGGKIPVVGMGLWQVKDREDFKEMFAAAIKDGYRHFDTAQLYGNEDILGESIVKSGIKRDEFFITTKILITHFGYNHTLKSFTESLAKLQTPYVDLLLLHFPVSLLRKGSWKALEELHQAGSAKDIGVSNYTVDHLKEMDGYAKTMPSVNQIELHVFLQQAEIRQYCQAHNIAVEAYSPLAHARDMSNQVIAEIAKKHQKTYAQIMLRWCLQEDCIVLPKSVTPARILENIDLFNFELDTSDMQRLKTLDTSFRTSWDPTHVP